MFLYDSHNLDIPACEEKKERKKEKKEIYVYLFGFGNSVIFELMKN